MKLRHAIALLFLILVVREIAYSEIRLLPEPCRKHLVAHILKCDMTWCEVIVVDGTKWKTKLPFDNTKGETLEVCPLGP